MYQYNPLLLEGEGNLEATGAVGAGIAGEELIRRNIPYLHGVETRYHNTSLANVDSIMNNGILGSKANDANSYTRKVLGGHIKGSDLDNLVYVAKNKGVANAVGNGRLLRGYGPGKTLKIKMNYDDFKKLQKVSNPELLGAKNGSEFIKRLIDTPDVKKKFTDLINGLPQNQKKLFVKYLKSGKTSDLPWHAKSLMNLMGKYAYHTLGNKTDTIKGNIAAKHIVGSKHYVDPLANGGWSRYVKNNKGRFAKGVIGAGAGLTALGTAAYLGKKAYDKKHQKKEF